MSGEMAGAEWRRVFRMRAEAFGTGRSVPDYQRSCSYLPDGTVRPFGRYSTIAGVQQARDDARLCRDLDGAIDDLPPSAPPAEQANAASVGDLALYLLSQLVGLYRSFDGEDNELIRSAVEAAERLLAEATPTPPAAPATPDIADERVRLIRARVQALHDQAIARAMSGNCRFESAPLYELLHDPLLATPSTPGAGQGVDS